MPTKASFFIRENHSFCMFENLTGKGTVLFPAEEAGEGVGVPSCGVGEGEAREESGVFSKVACLDPETAPFSF